MKVHASIKLVLIVMLLLLTACAAGASPTAAPESGDDAGEVVATEVTDATDTEPGDMEATEPAGETGTDAPMGDLSGEVQVLGAFTGAEQSSFEEAIAVFEEANPGVDVVYTGAQDFDTLIEVQVQGGDAPDIAAFPQPGGAARLAAAGNLAPLWPEAIAVLEANYAPVWQELGTFDGTPYGIFHRVNAKGWIWYNKPDFEEAGYEIPTTWDELMALTEEMKSSDRAPWCEGILAGEATGWKGTDWIENIMLRTQSLETYDAWVAGELPFSSPEVTNAFETLGEIWTDDDAVYGGRAAIAATDVPLAATYLFGDAPSCWLHMQGSFVTGFLQDDVQADLDNQLGVFIMPPIDPNVTPALEVGGDVFVVTAGNDRPEVRAFIEFLGTVESTTSWASTGGALFPHRGQDLSVYATDLERTMAETISAAEAARFDGSDNMASETNRAFWAGVTNWVSESSSLEEALTAIDEAAP